MAGEKTVTSPGLASTRQAQNQGGHRGHHRLREASRTSESRGAGNRFDAVGNWDGSKPYPPGEHQNSW